MSELELGDDEDSIETRRQEQQARADTLAKELKEDIGWLMSSPRGRRFVWRVLEKSGVHRTSYPADANMAFREGRRDMGLMVEAWVVEHSFNRYIEMLTETRKK